MKFANPGAIVAALLLTTGAAVAQDTGNAERGKQIFMQCRACHSLDPGKNMFGPSLHGLFGRKSGTEPGYNYSSAMKNANIVWNEDTLLKYLADPHKDVPGDKMPFAGIKDPGKLKDLLAYLKTATK